MPPFSSFGINSQWLLNIQCASYVRFEAWTHGQAAVWLTWYYVLSHKVDFWNLDFIQVIRVLIFMFICTSEIIHSHWQSSAQLSPFCREQKPEKKREGQEKKKRTPIMIWTKMIKIGWKELIKMCIVEKKKMQDMRSKCNRVTYRHLTESSGRQGTASKEIIPTSSPKCSEIKWSA